MHLNPVISQRDISVIIQGGVLDAYGELDVKFLQNLELTNKALSECEIIVSTWKAGSLIENKLVASYPAVHFIFNEDVGALEKEVDSVTVVCNVNRMIVSSLYGLKAATRAYAIKMRTDSYLYNDNIVKVLNRCVIDESIEDIKNIQREDKYVVFSKHVINCNLFARNPASHLPFLFHPGDILFAGLRKDIISIFEIPLANESLFEHRRSFMNACYMKLVPEQYIWVKNIEKLKGALNYSGNFSSDKNEIMESERFYLNNFIPFDSPKLGFVWRKHNEVYFNKGWASLYQTFDWVNLYRKYILKSAPAYPAKWYYRELKILFMKIYFIFRTQLLRVPFVRKLAFKIFVKRGN